MWLYLSRLTHAICLVTVLMCGTGAVAQAYTGPKVLGPYQIGHRYLVKTLSSLLGRPEVPHADAVLCYRSGNAGYLWIKTMAGSPSKVGGVLLSSFPNCVTSPVRNTREVVKNWKTKEGIGIGSTKQNVLTSYGKPSRDDLVKGVEYRWVVYGDYDKGHYSSRSMPERGEEVLVYLDADTLCAAEFGLRNGRVAWIFLSEDE